MSPALARVAFLFDVDNTLLDNDRVRRDLAETIEGIVGPERGRRFWELYEDVRRERDYVDFPHTLQRFHESFPDEPGFPAMADAVLAYPYRSAVFPGAHEVLRRVRTVGPGAILSDGDPVYQPAKIARAGLPMPSIGASSSTPTRSFISTRSRAACRRSATSSWTTSSGSSRPPRSASATS